MSDLHKSGMIASMSGLFESSEFSDLTVDCHSDTYKLHRAIVYQRSRLFATACKELKEGATATISLNDDDPAAVRRMLTYIYTLEYDDGEATMVCKLISNVRVYALAEKYCIPELKELANTKFKTLIQSDLAKFFQSLEVVYLAVFEGKPATDEPLRDMVIGICADNIGLAIECKEFDALVREHQDFGLWVLREVAKRSDERISQLEGQKKTLQERLVRLKEELGSLYRVATALSLPDQDDEPLRYEGFGHGFRLFQHVIFYIEKGINSEV